MNTWSQECSLWTRTPRLAILYVLALVFGFVFAVPHTAESTDNGLIYRAKDFLDDSSVGLCVVILSLVAGRRGEIWHRVLRTLPISRRLVARHLWACSNVYVFLLLAVGAVFAFLVGAGDTSLTSTLLTLATYLAMCSISAFVSTLRETRSTLSLAIVLGAMFVVPQLERLSSVWQVSAFTILAMCGIPAYLRAEKFLPVLQEELEELGLSSEEERRVFRQVYAEAMPEESFSERLVFHPMAPALITPVLVSIAGAIFAALGYWFADFSWAASEERKILKILTAGFGPVAIVMSADLHRERIQAFALLPVSRWYITMYYCLPAFTSSLGSVVSALCIFFAVGAGSHWSDIVTDFIMFSAANVASLYLMLFTYNATPDYTRWLISPAAIVFLLHVYLGNEIATTATVGAIVVSIVCVWLVHRTILRRPQRGYLYA